MQKLADQLRELGFTVNVSFTQFNVVVIEDFEVKVGKHAGRKIRVGVPAHDFPFTAPAGLHISPILAQSGVNNISQSPLGPEWQYWSRRLDDWKDSDRNARHVLSYINKVMLNAT